eukprot:8234683-Pyramimonas_sp.AAC.1
MNFSSATAAVLSRASPSPGIALQHSSSHSQRAILWAGLAWSCANSSLRCAGFPALCPKLAA